MKRIIAIFFAVILLVSNVGLTYATHFCMGIPVENQLMLGQHSLDCGMPDMDVPCGNSENDQEKFNREHCCDNHFQTLQVEDPYKSDIQKVDLNVQFIAAFVYSYFLFTNYSDGNQLFSEYQSPSPPDQDLLVLNQVFRL